MKIIQINPNKLLIEAKLFQQDGKNAIYLKIVFQKNEDEEMPKNDTHDKKNK